MLGLTAGNSGIFTQSGGTNMSMVHAGDNQRYYTALSLGFVPGAYGQYNLQGGNLDPAAIFVGGNTSQGSSVPNAGTGVFVQTGGSVGITGVTGTKAVGLAVGGNWMGTDAHNPTSFNTSAVGTYTLGNADGWARGRSWSAASKASGLAAPALSPSTAGPTTSSAEGPVPGF